MPDVPLFTDDARPLARVHDIIAAANGYPYPHQSVQPFPDYMDPAYDAEARRVRTAYVPWPTSQLPWPTVFTTATALTDVEQSLVLMTRSGHRHRVADLIGGDHLSPAAARAARTRAEVRARASHVARL